MTPSCATVVSNRLTTAGDCQNALGYAKFDTFIPTSCKTQIGGLRYGDRPLESGQLAGPFGSYWQTFTLHAGIKLNLFSQFGGGRLSAGEVAQQLGTDRRGTTMLLNALTAMGLLEKSSHRYSATDAASKFLDKSSPAYIGHMIMHHHFLADTWARMDEAVTTGRPLRSRPQMAAPASVKPS
jgi:hypothetical protein